MKSILIAAFLTIYIFDVNAEIIYLEPVQNAKLVSIYNNIIIGFNETIESSDPGSLINVHGSLSGKHTGGIVITGDRKKLIFKPHQPFVFNEKIEVRLNRVKTSGKLLSKFSYTFHTQPGRPEWDHKNSLTDEFGTSFLNNVSQSNNYSDSYDPPVLTVSSLNNPSKGEMYLSNFPFQAIPNTPYLLNVDNSGAITYSREVYIWSLDYKKQPDGMLTYYEYDKYFGEDADHNIIDSFFCGNGYTTDHHELKVIGNGHALVMSYDPQTVDMSIIVPGGNPNATVIGLIIQELDENNNVVFQWRSWDHIAITDAVHENLTAPTVDYIHGNAIELDNDGNILISSRHLSEITKISRSTGGIIWRLGGIHNQFTFLNDTLGFSYQHDIRRIPNGNITLYDNGNYHTPSFSRAVEYDLDETNKTATLVWQYGYGKNRYGFAMGSVQRLHNGNTLISWGSTNPDITEVTPEGNIALQMSLPAGIYTYRTFKDDADLTLNIKLAIQGFYNNETGTLSAKDTVRAYLRNNVSPFNIADSSIALIDSVSLTGNFRFYNVTSGSFYISTRHRNALETWSRSGGETFTSGGVYSYDFTKTRSRAYGNNLVLKGAKYCIFSGDVNSDGNINLTDILSVSNDGVIFKSGYINTDLNGDRIAELNDLMISYNNSIKFISVIKP